MVQNKGSSMVLEAHKSIDELLRSMRQAFNGRDLKTYRSHFWTDTRFIHLDVSGRTDVGWGAFEEILDQEFRYLDSVKLELRNLRTQVFEDKFACVVGDWKVSQVDAGGRTSETSGRVSYVMYRFDDGWKIVSVHHSPLVEEGSEKNA